MQRQHFLAASTVGLLFTLGAAVGLDGACSPTGGGLDASADAPVCNPDSGDPAGCPCDPSKDKQTTCYSGPPGTVGKGFCQAGTRSCVNGKFTSCVGEVVPQPEVCNLADDDCDGIIDDLPEIADAAVLGHCNSPACGTEFADAAITCWGPDPGICGAGTKTCAPGPKGGTPTGCNEFVHTPVQEICNGLDDDCNGLVDDGLNNEGTCDLPDGATWDPDANPLEAGPDGSKSNLVLGECVHGNLTCEATNCNDHGCADAGDVCKPSQPGFESCNGKDDDCNGVVDEGTCLNYPTGYNWCCAYQNNTFAYCTSSFLGDGGVGQFYNCHYAR